MRMNAINLLCNVKFILEFFYYIAGIAVGIGVWVSIKLYFLSKKDINLKYSREINSITGEQLRKFYIEILPIYDKLKNTNSQLFFFDEKINIIKVDDNNIKESAENYYNNLSQKDDYKKTAKELLVNIQILSANFQFGTADIKLAKEMILDQYLDIFEAVFPIIFQEKDKKLYQSCIDLYNQ